jgi:hypothetical protein
MTEHKEPELITLWRKIIAERDRLAANVRRWEEFQADQRAGWRPLEEYPEERREHIAKMRAHSEDLILPLRASLQKLDREINSGARENANDRGHSLAQLARLARWHADADAKHVEAWVLQYLREVDPSDRERTANTVCALLGRDDLSELEQRAREARGDGTGKLETLARRIVELARA